jgi:hypothetical protein
MDGGFVVSPGSFRCAAPNYIGQFTCTGEPGRGPPTAPAGPEQFGGGTPLIITGEDGGFHLQFVDPNEMNLPPAEDVVGGVAKAIGDVVGGAVNSVEKAVGGVVNSVENAVGGAVNSVEKAVGGVVNSVEKAIGGWL